MPLEKELAQFDKMKQELLKHHSGKFALIHGEHLIGAFDTPANAYVEGVKRFGREAFLIRQIAEVEQVVHL